MTSSWNLAERKKNSNMYLGSMFDHFVLDSPNRSCPQTHTAIPIKGEHPYGSQICVKNEGQGNGLLFANRAPRGYKSLTSVLRVDSDFDFIMSNPKPTTGSFYQEKTLCTGTIHKCPHHRHAIGY